MKAYRAYLFDWDGTLARTTEIWLSEIKRVLQAHGVEVNDRDNAKNLGSLTWFNTLGLAGDVLEEVHQEIADSANARLPGVELYDGAVELLKELKRSGKKIALITSTMPRSLQIVMGRHGLSEYFDTIITGKDVSKSKPDPEGIQLALKKLGVLPDEAVLIGDNYKDLLAAQNAKIDSILFYPDSHELLYDLRDLKKHSPTYIVRHMIELLNELKTRS